MRLLQPGKGSPALARLLAVLAALSTLPPYVGAAVGLELDVPTRLEVADHVVPGLAALAASLGVAVLVRAGRSPLSAGVLVLAGSCVLAGLWQVSTHVPLLLQSGSPGVPAAAVLLHAVPGLGVLTIAVLLFGSLLRAAEQQ